MRFCPLNDQKMNVLFLNIRYIRYSIHVKLSKKILRHEEKQISRHFTITYGTRSPLLPSEST